MGGSPIAPGKSWRR